MGLDKTEITLMLFLTKQRMTEVPADGFEYATLVGLEQTLTIMLEEAEKAAA